MCVCMPAQADIHTYNLPYYNHNKNLWFIQATKSRILFATYPKISDASFPYKSIQLTALKHTRLTKPTETVKLKHL